jgi:hypothetical protein
MTMVMARHPAIPQFRLAADQRSDVIASLQMVEP